MVAVPPRYPHRPPAPSVPKRTMTTQLLSFSRQLFPNRLRILTLAVLVYAALC